MSLAICPFMQTDPGLLQLRNGYLYKTSLTRAVERVKMYTEAEGKRQNKGPVSKAICNALHQISRKCSRNNETKAAPTAEILLSSWLYQLDRKDGIEAAIAPNLLPDSARAEKEPRKQEVIEEFLTAFRHFVQTLSDPAGVQGAQHFRKRVHDGLLNLTESARTSEVECPPPNSVATLCTRQHTSTVYRERMPP